MQCSLCVTLVAGSPTAAEVKSRLTATFHAFGTILRIHVSRNRQEATITFTDHASVVQAMSVSSLFVERSFCLGDFSNASEENDEFNLKVSRKVRVKNLPSNHPTSQLVQVLSVFGDIHKIVRGKDFAEIHFMETRGAFSAVSCFVSDGVSLDYGYPYTSKHLCVDHVDPAVSTTTIADFFDRIGTVSPTLDVNHCQVIVTMQTVTEAVMAREFLHGGVLGDERVTLDFVDEEFVVKFNRRLRAGRKFVNDIRFVTLSHGGVGQ